MVCSPLHNLLALWVLSHACLYPGHWLLAISLLLTAVLMWRITIQVCCSCGCGCGRFLLPRQTA